MIEKYIDILRQLRNNEIDISDFHYKASINSEGHSYDENQRKRFQLLIALKYDRTKNDQPLLQDLLRQEIEMHRKAPFQGLFPSIQLNSFLLSTFRNPENIWLFLDAKRANFDTHCGYDSEYLISSGIKQTFDLVDKSNNESKKDFYEYIGKSIDSIEITENDLKTWLTNKSSEYNDKPELENIEDEIQLAIDLDEKDILKKKIREWTESLKTWNDQTLYQLSYYEGLVDNVAGQISANEKLFEIKSSDWDKATCLQTLSQLYLKSNNPIVAWEKIKLAQTYLSRISDCKEVGLGRFIVENAFDVVLCINDSNNLIVKEAFAWAIKEVNNMKNLHHNLLEKTGKASELMGDIKSRDKFFRILEVERAKLDKMLNRKSTVHNSSLPKAGRSWWQKLFGSE